MIISDPIWGRRHIFWDGGTMPEKEYRAWKTRRVLLSEHEIPREEQIIQKSWSIPILELVRRDDGTLAKLPSYSHHKYPQWAYDFLLKRQNGKCLGCGISFLHANCNIDHNHKTGAVRGLLCNSCNAKDVLKDKG